jgi:hypothetical protein
LDHLDVRLLHQVHYLEHVPIAEQERFHPGWHLVEQGKFPDYLNCSLPSLKEVIPYRQWVTFLAIFWKFFEFLAGGWILPLDSLPCKVEGRADRLA